MCCYKSKKFSFVIPVLGQATINMFKLFVLAFVCLSGIHAASIAGTFDEKPAASVLPEFVAGDLIKPAPAVEASVLPEFVAGDLIKPAPVVEASVLPEFVAGDLIKPAPVVEASVLPEFVAGDFVKPAPAVEASVLPEFVAGDFVKPAAPEASVLPGVISAPEAACESDSIQDEIIAVPELEIQLPVAPEIVATPELENPCAEVEEEVSPVAPEVEVIVPDTPVVRPLPVEEEPSVVVPEIEVILPEADACSAVEEEVVGGAPVASILPAPSPSAVDASQLISAFPAKFE